MMLDVLVGVVIEGFRVSTAGPMVVSGGRLRRPPREEPECDIADTGGVVCNPGHEEGACEIGTEHVENRSTRDERLYGPSVGPRPDCGYH